MAFKFDADVWLDRWTIVGGIMQNVAGVALVANLDGNAAEQQSLLSQLDSVRGRRALVRDAALSRFRRV